jgi:hypothetical protein
MEVASGKAVVLNCVVVMPTSERGKIVKGEPAGSFNIFISLFGLLFYIVLFRVCNCPVWGVQGGCFGGKIRGGDAVL